MSFNTSVYRLGDLAEVNWGDTSTTKSAYTATGFRAFSASGPDGLLPYNDHDRTGIVVGAIGANCGETWLAEGKWSSIKNTITAWSKSPDLDTRYLYWLTKRKGFFPIRGSAQPFISQGDARSIEIEIPPIHYQKAIAHILGTLDDKIELNRKTNETLEGIAKALFKSWFVDFDPVRAKAEGRSTGLPDEVSELFPDSLEESELGEIPSGWEVMPWGDLITLQYGKSLKGYKDSGKTIPVYGTNGIAGYTENPLVDNEGIIVGRKGAYRGIHYSDEPFFVIDTAFYVASKSNKHLPSRWCFYSMKSIDMESIDSGSAIPSTSREDFYSIEFVCPSRGIQELFEKLLAPAWRRQRSLSEESKILESLRDSLLPRLISGELRVPDAEKMLEEVGI